MKDSVEFSVPSLDEIYSKIGIGKFHYIVLVILGCVQFFDSVELILLSFLGPILNCKWKISMMESSFISISVFIGMMFGALGFGKSSDIFGRKPNLVICVCGIYYFGLLCAASPTLCWIVFTRTVVGIFIGGATTIIFINFVEFSPVIHRGRMVIYTQLFFSLGSFYISLLTIGLVPTFGWRIWLLLAILPMFLIILLILWIPESPRYLIVANRKKEAINVINKIAQMNEAEPVLNVRNVLIEKSSLLDLFHPSYARITIIMSIIWLVIGLDYYGFVFSSSIVNNIPHKCLQNFSKIFNPSQYLHSYIDNSCCFDLSWKTIGTVLISVTGETLAYIIAIILINSVSRKRYLQCLLIIDCTVFFLMNLCLSPTNMGILLIFGRGASTSSYGINYIYTSEIYPTIIRGTASGVCLLFSRLGSMISSFIINNLMAEISYFGATLFYVTINIVAILLTCLLPYDTRDKPLKESFEKDNFQ